MSQGKVASDSNAEFIAYFTLKVINETPIKRKCFSFSSQCTKNVHVLLKNVLADASKEQGDELSILWLVSKVRQCSALGDQKSLKTLQRSRRQGCIRPPYKLHMQYFLEMKYFLDIHTL